MWPLSGSQHSFPDYCIYALYCQMNLWYFKWEISFKTWSWIIPVILMIWYNANCQFPCVTDSRFLYPYDDISTCLVLIIDFFLEGLVRAMALKKVRGGLTGKYFDTPPPPFYIFSSDPLSPITYFFDGPPPLPPLCIFCGHPLPPLHIFGGMSRIKV